MTGKASSGFTRGAGDTMLVSWRATFAVAFPALSFFNFFKEEPCFPISLDLFWTRYQLTSEYGTFRPENYWSKLKLLITLLSSMSPSLLSPCPFSESDSRLPVFSRRSSSESSSNYEIKNAFVVSDFANIRSSLGWSINYYPSRKKKRVRSCKEKYILPTVFLFDWRDQLSPENFQQWWQRLCHQMRN